MIITNTFLILSTSKLPTLKSKIRNKFFAVDIYFKHRHINNRIIINMSMILRYLKSWLTPTSYSHIDKFEKYIYLLLFEQ